MSVLSIPNAFSPNTTILSSQVNANFSAISTEYNAHAVQTDVAKTITASHTFSVSQTFSGGIVVTLGMTVSGASTFGTINGQTITSGAQFTGSAVFAGPLAVSNNALVTPANLRVSNTLAVAAQFGVLMDGTISSAGTAQGIAYVANMQTAAAAFTCAQVVGFYYANTPRGGASVITNQYGFYCEAVSGAGTGNYAFYSAGAGITSLGDQLVVRANGINVTGNSTITGNLVVTGSITAVTGSSSYVRRTSDLNFAGSTDLTLTFAIGATEEWEFEYVLAHTNASAATASFTVSAPAAATGFFGGLGTTNNAAAAIVGDAEVTFGNAMSNFNMNATAAWAHIRGYVKGGGTPGNVTINGTASAGTGVLKAGSYVRYARVA